MSVARLSLRPNEVAEYFETYVAGAFAVALVQTPELPGEAHPECMPLTSVCAGTYKCNASQRPGEVLWGWYQMDAETKEEIGKTLEAEGCEIGRWYYMRVRTREEL